jgi:hypothetical protein
MVNAHTVNLITIILISLSFICIGGVLYELYKNIERHTYQPLLWPLAMGFSSAGGCILVGLILKHLLPSDIMDEMRHIKSYKI